MRRLDILYDDKLKVIKQKLDTALENEITIKNKRELINIFSGEVTERLETVIITGKHIIRLYTYYEDSGSDYYVYRYVIKKRP